MWYSLLLVLYAKRKRNVQKVYDTIGKEDGMMTEKEKACQGLLYNANYDKQLLNERKACKDMCFEYNQLKPSDQAAHEKLLEKLLGEVGEEIEIVQPFWCDYGYHIHMKDHVFINHNCVMLDGADITIGNHVFIGPNCGFHTAGHPCDVEQRNAGLEYAYPITIGDNVWIGANVTVLAGVTIGNNSIIGAGSVVTKDIPDHVIAVGNPCRIMKKMDD